jgi:hypothetical protein
VSVNGRRLKEGPYTTLMRPARLDPARSLLLGPGVRGAQPGEEQVLQLQLVNELDENLTTCSSSGEDVVGVVAEAKCGALRAEACRARADCEWLAVEGAVGAGVCNTLRQRELVEIYLKPIKSAEETSSGGAAETGAAQTAGQPPQPGQASESPQAGANVEDSEGAGEEKKAGVVRSCDHGTYTLSYSMAEAGRYSLHVKVAGLNAGLRSLPAHLQLFVCFSLLSATRANSWAGSDLCHLQVSCRRLFADAGGRDADAGGSNRRRSVARDHSSWV